MEKVYKSVSFELKALSEREFEGHGSIFGNVDLGRDIVVRGAFAATLKEHAKAGTLPQLFWMHKMDAVPGMWTEMKEDKRGLYCKGILADTQLGNEMRTLMTMKAVRGLSIGFTIKDREWTDEGIRLIKDVDLWEVSIVSLAMNPLARVESAKSRLSVMGEYVPEHVEFRRELEEHLREKGCSQRVAKTMVARLFGETSSEMFDDNPQRDVEDELLSDADKAEAKKIAEYLKGNPLVDNVLVASLNNRK